MREPRIGDDMKCESTTHMHVGIAVKWPLIFKMHTKSWNSVLAFFRVLFVISVGYVHPDEFFQCGEPMAKDICKFNALKTWEWNSSLPIRNVMFPFYASGIPFWCLCGLQKMLDFRANGIIFLFAQRIMMVLLVHAIEKCFFEICKCLFGIVHADGIDWCIFLFRSSYLSLVLLTRTFSNTAETFFYGVLLLFSWNKSQVWDVQTKNCQRSIPDMIFGFCLAFGFFVRPSFLVFAFYPLMHTGIVCMQRIKSISELITVLRFGVCFVTGFLCGSFVCILADCIYYASKDIAWCPLTPWNFLKYNGDISRLQQHGLHPRFLHILVNMNLLYGPCYWIFLAFGSFQFIRYLILTFRKGLAKSILVPELSLFLFISGISALCFFSAIPHQEPRFLEPLCIPVIIFAGKLSFIWDKGKNLFVSSWVVFNLLCTAWYGFLHQGGIVPSLFQNYNNLCVLKGNTSMHLVYWQTYMTPRHLLALPEEKSHLHVYDLGGCSAEHLMTSLKEIKGNGAVQMNILIALLAPGSLRESIEKNFPSAVMHRQFFPHVSVEDPPSFNSALGELFHCWDVASCWLGLQRAAQLLHDELSLSMYLIE